MNLNYSLITTEQDLLDVCSKIILSDHVAVDTEFKRETTYFPIPCLIQLATPELTVCIDPQEITNLEPLKNILSSPEITKIFHASRQDLEIFYFMFNEIVSPVFDTQVAASILGHTDQIGYANLVKQVLNVELDKSQTRTDWSKRPFTPQQLAYAANDVIYLLQLYQIQMDELSTSNKKDWPNEEFFKLYNENLYKPDPENAWKKIKNYQHLPLEQKKIAYKLSIWREHEAVKRNRPRKFVLSNAAMLDIASKQPSSVDDLSTLNDLNNFVIQRYGNQLITLVNESKKLGASNIPQAKHYEILSIEEKKQIKQIQSLINDKADEAKVSNSIIANRKELEKIIRGDREVDVLKGWRYELAGKEILKLVDNN